MTDLAQRYRPPHPARRPILIALVALLAVAGLGGLAWAAWFQATPQVTSSLVGYQVVSDHEVSARYEVVRRSTGTRASCLLQALAADHSVVGEQSFPVTSGPTDQTLTASLRTERSAAAVTLVGCVAPGQKQPR